MSIRPGRLVNNMLSAVGLRITSVADAKERVPVELKERDRKILSYVCDNQLSTSVSSKERLFATLMACRYAVESRIDGDFVECGVWRGGHAILAAGVYADAGASSNVWLYDTFAGMTAPTAVDVNFRGEDASGKYSVSERGDHNEWCYAPLDQVKENFARAGLLSDRIRFVKGDVAQTLTGTAELPERIGVLRLDTDWYASTKLELEVLYPRLVRGGVLIIDDYGHWDGARKAVDEYFVGKKRPFLQYIDQTARIGVKLD